MYASEYNIENGGSKPPPYGILIYAFVEPIVGLDAHIEPLLCKSVQFSLRVQ